ncbi:histidine phosphatase family protein [Flindersiella endophytica]
MTNNAVTVVFVRHGETPQHAENRYVGRSDVPLTPRGHEQAAALALWAKQAGLTGIWSSPLRRARETAEPSAAAAGLEVRVDDRLVELDFGQGEGLTSKEMREQFPEARAAFEDDPYHNPLPGGERPALATARVRQVLDELGNGVGGEKVLVVAHGTLLRLLLCDVFGVDPDRYRHAFPDVHNTSGAVLRLSPERGWGLVAWNAPLVADSPF